jgi:PAS domain S-box-containing protein
MRGFLRLATSWGCRVFANRLKTVSTTSVSNGMLSQLVFPQDRGSAAGRYTFGAICCVAAFLVRLLLDPLLQDRSPLLVFGVAVAVSAIRGGFGPGLLSTFLGVFGAVYFFPPIGNFLAIDPKYRTTAAFQLLIFLAAGLILSWLGGELRRLRWQALRLARQRNQILESITDGFAALDRNMRFIYLNRLASQLIGTPRPEVVGKKIWDELPAWQGTLVESKLREASDQHRPVRFDYQPSSADRWFDFHVNPVENGELTIYFTDITERKVAEMRLRDTLAQRDVALLNVRLLSGLLPICAACKQIRDENGNWHQLEAYISDHSQAKFSHGLCPKCLVEYLVDRG